MSTKLYLLALVLVVAGVSGFAGQQPTTRSEFDRATRGMDRHGIAEYVFQTYGCHVCHVATATGQAGFTERGEQARQRFVGCVRLLTAVAASTGSASTPTAEQREVNETFKEFGCAFCHSSASGVMGFTDVGRELGSLHLGCVEVRQEVNKGKGGA